MRLFITCLILLSCSTQLFSNDKKPSASEKDIVVHMSYKLLLKDRVDTIGVIFAMPQTIKNRQTINDIAYSVEPDSSYLKNNNRYVLYKFYNPGKDITIKIKIKATIYRMILDNNEYTDSNFNRYLKAEPFIEKDKPEIRDLAATLMMKNDIETVIKTFTYVKEHITYKLNNAVGADSVLKSGMGKCMDFSDLFNALLRANNIPAKSVYGMTLQYDGDPGLHAWSEVYLKKQGWILFDPTTGHSDINQDGNNFKMRISNKYFILAEGRNCASLYWYWWRGETGSNLSIRTSFTIYED